MFVKEIKDYDILSNEADIIISDGKYELLCYCFQTEMLKKGQAIKAVKSFFAKNIMRLEANEFLIKKLEGYYSYHLQGEVVDSKIPKIRIGNLIISLDAPLPKDIKEKEYVEFSVDRLECEFFN